MKIFKFMIVALVAMCGLNSCSDDCNHEFIEHDFTQDLVGTWTYLDEGQAEAMVIKADGSFEVTGVMNGGNGALYEEKGTIKVVNNKVTLAFDGDTDVFEGRLEFVAGKSMSIVMFDDNDVRLTYNYCKEDLSDEVVGMWVCHESLPGVENDMAIITYSEDGKMSMTAQASAFIAGDFVNVMSDYKVVGDLVFKILPKENVPTGAAPYIASRLVYTPNGTSLGDILTETQHVHSENGMVKLTSSFLRVKQVLNLTGKTYDYSAAYVTNAKGADEDFSITGCNFNIANIKASDFDMMFRAVLYCVEFPNANTIKQYFRPNGIDGGFETPITVEGNKVTLDMSAGNPAFRKVEMYMFQDKDDSQLHMYMPTSSFINYFANLEITTMLIEGKIDPTDAAAVEKVFTDMEARIESINVSFVFKARK